MKRTAVAMMLVTALGGCMSVNNGPDMAGPVCRGSNGPVAGPPMIPGVQGPMGQGVPVAAPYNAPMNASIARYMMNQSVPLSSVHLKPVNGQGSGIVQASANVPGGGMPGMAMPPGGLMMPPGMPMGPGMMPPGMMPPGQGMMPPGMMPPGKGMMPPGANMMAASGPMVPPGAMPLGPPPRFKVARTQVRFVRPSGMKIAWFTTGSDGKPSYSSASIETPGRYNFLQAAIYRLKLSGIEGRPGLELYPTLEVVPTNPRTEAFLAHNAVPVAFSKEDFDQVAEGNYLVKVIYLPDPANQELAATGPDEIVSTRLEPGADPIKEALRRGSILLVIRMGNMDQEAPNTPPIDAPGPGGAQPMMPPPGMIPPGMMPGGMPAIAPGMGGAMHGPGPMIPYTNPTGHGNPMMAPGGPPMLGPMNGMPFQFPGGGGMGIGVGSYPTGMPMQPMPGAPQMPPAGMQGPVPPAGMMPPQSRAPVSGSVRQASAAQPYSAGSALPLPPTPAALASQEAASGR